MVADDHGSGAERCLDDGVAEGLLAAGRHEHDVRVGQVAPHVVAKPVEVHALLESRAPHLLVQLLLVPLVAGKDGPDECERRVQAPVPQLGDGLDGDVDALAGRESADIGQPRRTVDLAARCRHGLGSGDTVVDHEGPACASTPGRRRDLPGDLAVVDDEVGQTGGQREAVARHSGCRGLCLVHVVHGAHAHGPADGEPQRDRQRVDVDDVRAHPADEPHQGPDAAHHVPREPEQAHRSEVAAPDDGDGGDDELRPRLLELCREGTVLGRRDHDVPAGSDETADGLEHHAVRTVEVGRRVGHEGHPPADLPVSRHGCDGPIHSLSKL